MSNANCAMDVQNELLRDQIENFAERSRREQKRFFANKPKTAKDVMAAVMNRRGYGRVLSLKRYNEVIRTAVGDQLGSFVQVAGLRRGRLDVVVANSSVMQELTFLQQKIMEELAAAIPNETIENIRFRIGPIDTETN